MPSPVTSRPSDAFGQASSVRGRRIRPHPGGSSRRRKDQAGGAGCCRWAGGNARPGPAATHWQRRHPSAFSCGAHTALPGPAPAAPLPITAPRHGHLPPRPPKAPIGSSFPLRPRILLSYRTTVLPFCLCLLRTAFPARSRPPIGPTAEPAPPLFTLTGRCPCHFLLALKARARTPLCVTRGSDWLRWPSATPTPWYDWVSAEGAEPPAGGRWVPFYCGAEGRAPRVPPGLSRSLAAVTRRGHRSQPRGPFRGSLKGWWPPAPWSPAAGWSPRPRKPGTCPAGVAECCTRTWCVPGGGGCHRGRNRRIPGIQHPPSALWTQLQRSQIIS